MKKKSPCEGCVYWNPVNLRDKSELYFCSYCYDTGTADLVKPEKAAL